MTLSAQQLKKQKLDEILKICTIQLCYKENLSVQQLSYILTGMMFPHPFPIVVQANENYI